MPVFFLFFSAGTGSLKRSQRPVAAEKQRLTRFLAVIEQQLLRSSIRKRKNIGPANISFVYRIQEQNSHCGPINVVYCVARGRGKVRNHYLLFVSPISGDTKRRSRQKFRSNSFSASLRVYANRRGKLITLVT